LFISPPLAALTAALRQAISFFLLRLQVLHSHFRIEPAAKPYVDLRPSNRAVQSSTIPDSTRFAKVFLQFAVNAGTSLARDHSGGVLPNDIHRP
jgi:hypothetical protein